APHELRGDLLEVMLYLVRHVIVRRAAAREDAHSARELTPERHRLTLCAEKSRDRGRPSRPVGGFGLQLLLSRCREPVEFCAARVLGLAPFGVEPTGANESLERCEKRPGV